MTATEKFIAVFNHLMGTTNQVDVIFLEETLNYGFSKRVAYTTIVFTPAALTFLWVRPKQIAKKTIFRDLCWPGDLLKL